MATYIFDLDGTLADCTHRLHFINNGKKDWPAFFAACKDDAPIHHMIELCAELEVSGRIVICSGRSDVVRDDTMRWLIENGLSPDLLMMRKQGDHRPDHVVKLEMLTDLRAMNYNPTMAFDDRDQVVKMWRENGVPCAQVAPGDF